MIFNPLMPPARRQPELDGAYPLDIPGTVEFPYGGKTVTFAVKVSRAGWPRELHYTWYVDGKAQPDSDSAAFTWRVNAGGTVQVFCQVTNGTDQPVVSRTATVTGRAAKTLLYDRGQEGVSWDALDSGAADDPDYYGAAQKQTGKLRLTAKKNACYGGRCVTADRLDLRNYTTLGVTGYAWGKLTVAVASGQGEAAVLTHRESGAYNVSTGWSGTVTLDITDLDEGYPMVLAGPAQSADCYGEITEVYLE